MNHSKALVVFNSNKGLVMRIKSQFTNLLIFAMVWVVALNATFAYVMFSDVSSIKEARMVLAEFIMGNENSKKVSKLLEANNQLLEANEKLVTATVLLTVSLNNVQQRLDNALIPEGSMKEVFDNRIKDPVKKVTSKSVEAVSSSAEKVSDIARDAGKATVEAASAVVNKISEVSKKAYEAAKGLF